MFNQRDYGTKCVRAPTGRAAGAGLAPPRGLRVCVCVLRQPPPPQWDNANMVVLVYDVSNRESFQSSVKWLQRVQECTGRSLPGACAQADVMLRESHEGEWLVRVLLVAFLPFCRHTGQISACVCVLVSRASAGDTRFAYSRVLISAFVCVCVCMLVLCCVCLCVSVCVHRRVGGEQGGPARVWAGRGGGEGGPRTRKVTQPGVL